MDSIQSPCGSEFDLNNFVGIPFKLNRRDFFGCDCQGIVWLYYKHIRGFDMPFSDGGRIFFRDKKKDYARMNNGLKTFAKPIPVNDLAAGDIVIIKNHKSIGAIGVCVDKQFILHMDRIIGSCLTRIIYLENMFLAAYRPS